MKLFHASVEGAQHGKKGLNGFLEFAKYAGADGCQPSNFMLEDGGGGFLSAKEIRNRFESIQVGDQNISIRLMLDGISAHCPFWVHTTAWTGSKTIKPFLPAHMKSESVEKIELWAEDYILRLLDLCAELKVKIVPMFWGLAWGWELATGYPWGFWQSDEYDLVEEGDERFNQKTLKIREKANANQIMLCHEPHPNTGAVCAEDFLHMVEICDQADWCLGVNKDDSHCWEGESWQDRFDLVGDYVYACHMKNHHVRPGLPLRSMTADWPNRPMQFTALDEGDLNLIRSTEQLIRIGYAQRYCKLMNTKTAPLVVEAEGAFENLDHISARGIAWVRDHCCFEVAEGSFEKGMGDAK